MTPSSSLAHHFFETRTPGIPCDFFLKQLPALGSMDALAAVQPSMDSPPSAPALRAQRRAGRARRGCQCSAGWQRRRPELSGDEGSGTWAEFRVSCMDVHEWLDYVSGC